MKEIEKRSKMSPIKEILLLNKLKKSQRLFKKSQWLKTMLELSNRFWELVSQSGAQSTNKTLNKSSLRLTTEKLKYDYLSFFESIQTLSITIHYTKHISLRLIMPNLYTYFSFSLIYIYFM